MKLKSIFSLVLLLIGITSYSQICKYEVNETDPLTDDVIRTIKTRVTDPRPYYYFYYIRNGSDFQFKVDIADYGELSEVIKKGSELILRAGNGKVIRMKAVDDAKPEIIKEFSDVLTRYEITYYTTQGAMKSIAASGIKFIRISDMKNTFSDQEIPEAVVQISKENAECIFK